MGGTIGFTSEEDKGSSFFFSIPLVESEAPHEVVPAKGKKQAAVAVASHDNATKKSHLLLAEDDPTIRAFLGRMMEKVGYEIDCAEDGQKAVQMWEDGGYDLILMDVQMPHLNGFEATAAIREQERSHGRHIPIVAMTAHAGKNS